MTDKDEKSQSKQRKSDEDAALWNHITKDITPLKKHNSAKIEIEKPTTTSLKQKNSHIRHTGSQYQTPLKSGGNETDHRTAQRLKRGKMQIDGRLDLHGMTQNEAYDALLSFIPNAYSHGKRCLLIITGKGNRQDSTASLTNTKTGILKQKTPEWLRDAPLNTYVLKIETARPNHGGEGALYVLLRRNK